MKTTANQVKSFYNNHALKLEHERALQVNSMIYNHSQNVYNIFKPIETCTKKICTPVGEYRVYLWRRMELTKRISKDLHYRFKDYKPYVSYDQNPKLEIFDYSISYSYSIKLNGTTDLRFRNPLTDEFISLENSFNSDSDIPVVISNYIKSLFFGRGTGKYAEMQKSLKLTKSELLKKLQEDKEYKKSKYYDDSEDCYCLYATRKALKRNLGLIFNDYMSLDFISDAVNSIGTRNKGKEPKKVFRFDDSFIDTSNSIEEVERDYLQAFNNQSKNAILI